MRVSGPVRSASDLHIPLKLYLDPVVFNTEPKAALRILGVGEMCPDVSLQWLEGTRVNAVLGSCKHSLKSLRSGFSCFATFVRAAEPNCVEVIPPKSDLLLLWSTLFRSERSRGDLSGLLQDGVFTLRGLC